MDLESTVREHCSALTSTRSTDRKRSAESLKDLLTRNALASLLNDNTLKRRGFTWNNLFDDINDYILKEAEKFESSKTFDTVTAPLCTSLLHMCVAGSNKGKAYIKCDRIVDASFNILKDARLTRAFGNAYLNLLYKYVLSCDHYLGYITPTNWEDLLNVCITACLGNNCRLDNYTKLKLVLLIIKSVKNYCQFIIPLRDSLVKIERFFTELQSDKNVKEILVAILICLLEMLSAECRLTMCDYTEKWMPMIVKFYEPNLDQKKKVSLFRLLEMILMIHHPGGKLSNEEGSMAANWDIWNKHLNSILEIVSSEITVIQKVRKQNESTVHNEHFFALAAAVYFQIFHSTANSDITTESGSVPKRQKITLNKYKTFSDLIHQFQVSYMPWLGIINIYMTKYGSSINKSDVYSLLKVIENLLSNECQHFDWVALTDIIDIALSKSFITSNSDEFTDILLALWSTCIRNSTSSNSTNKYLHIVIQMLLKIKILTYQNVQPLLKLYLEKSMPVNKSSVKTLNMLLDMYFSKFGLTKHKLALFDWFIHGDIGSVESCTSEEFLSRLISSENIVIATSFWQPECDHLFDTLFKQLDTCILYSEFESTLPSLSVGIPGNNNSTHENTEINCDVNRAIQGCLEERLSEHTERFTSDESQLTHYLQLITVVVAYIDILLKTRCLTIHQIKELRLFTLLETSLNALYISLTNVLKSNAKIDTKIKILQNIKELMVSDYTPFTCVFIRKAINEEFFHCINDINLSAENAIEDDIINEGDESDINCTILKYHCLYALAAYCRVRANYRDELLELILDPQKYNFTSALDVKCAYKIIDILDYPGMEEPPLEQVFTFMRHLCKFLFRSPQATFDLLNIFSRMLKRFWSDDNNMKQNCFIMIKGYLERCDKQFYPPNVAAMIYKCAAEIVSLNANENLEIDDYFIKSIIKKTKGDVHCLRLYCCYLLKFLSNYTNIDADVYLSDLSDIFVINVSERKQTVLKDESMNRTLTVLHSYSAMAHAKKAFLGNIINSALELLKEKSLDEHAVKKVLKTITNSVAKKDLSTYLNTNILHVLNFWCMKKHHIRDLPIKLFDIENQGMLLEKHMKWIVSTDILWRNDGNIHGSEVLKLAKDKLGLSESKIVEICFCNIIILCLPYIVAEKYKLQYTSTENQNQFKKTAMSAQRMFQVTREILGNEKWSNQFVENVGELLLLSATHLSDYDDTKLRFNVDVPKSDERFQYPKIVFSAILTYFGELTDGNIMQFLCENQPVAVFKILLKLWERVLQEQVYEHKTLAINAFVTFTEYIPLDSPADGFICNYVCNCFAYEIKKSTTKDEVRVLTLGLKMILERLLPQKVDVLRRALASLLSILIIKKEEGFTQECYSLLTYLMVDMKEYLKEGEDVVDYLKSMSQRSVEDVNCNSLSQFSDRLKTFKLALTCPSHETLCNLNEFLKMNKRYVNLLCNELNTKGFSEECGTSVIHQTIYILNNILKYITDSKTIMEACKCLVEIGTYDLKTLVTVPPANTKKVSEAIPKQSFAEAVVSSLLEVMFDENPTVTNKITIALYCLLKYGEDVQAIKPDEIEKTILKPFLSEQHATSAVFKIDDAKLNLCYGSDIMVPHGNVAHSEWLKSHTVQLLDVFVSETNYANVLKDVCSLKPEVCRKILPYLVSVLLSCSAERHITIIAEQMNRFFKYIWEISFDEQVDNSGDSSNIVRTNSLSQNHKFIIQYMLETVDVIRLQRKQYKTRSSRLETLNCLRLDYDKVAWAATVADQNLAAIYYAELWASALNDCVPPASPEETSALGGGRDVQRILRKSFVSIGEMDAIEGCGTAHLTMDEEKRKHLINTGQYQDALLLHDIALSYSHTDLELQCGVVRSLHKSGMHHLALQYIKSLPETADLNDIKYECLSFLGDWSEFVDTRDLEEKSKESNSNTYSVLKTYHYSCLKDCLNLHIKPDLDHKLVKPLERSKLAISRLSQKLNMENCQNFYKVLSKLHLFNDIEEYFDVRCNKLPLYDLMHKWRVENLPIYHDFKYLEDLIFQRNIILEHSAKLYESSLKEIVSLQLRYAELCLSNQRIQMAQRIVAIVKNLQKSEEVTLLESQLSWAKGHRDIALSLLRNIVSKRSNAPSPDLRQEAICLRQYGLWMAETKSDNPRDIINKYLKKSLDSLRKTDDTKIKLKVYFDIAKFADAEYKQILAYMNSSIFENKVKCLENMKDAYTTLRSTQRTQMTKEERKALLTNERFKKIDETDIASTRAEKECFLHLAVRYYLLSLKECEENNLAVFRVISLWLDNPGLVLDESEGGSFESLLHAIPSRKFIAVLPQLAPRLTDDDTPFSENLKKILLRCAEEHPHHTLPILFSIKNSDKDKYILNAGEEGGRRAAGAQEPRVAAAAGLARRLAQRSDQLADVVAQMERLCDATISFANYKPKGKEQRQKIPRAEKILKLLHLDAIPIPTDTVPVRNDCDYTSLCTLVAFDDYFEHVGGINCPKKINCKGSDGKKKILLIKGEDDLRQDAVMQQVFNIVNTLLEKDPITSRNKLLIRTYKVVPMSRQSGVLEWCEGTMPIGLYLVGPSNNGAHARYRPQDISCSAARQKLQKCYELKKNNEEKLATFLSILRELKPVFHYFFTEHYLDPITWYERRLAYTKSVVTSSMVGYIMGLGDRHVQNILIDKKTAEVIHIDFGIAFDEGKALPTPETIPFRLTQDIVAGFGCGGVEGIFRRCCEKTMQLLRDNQETLLTILEVLLCDPLYMWTINPAMSASAGTSTDTTVCGGAAASGLAARALLAVGSKLGGTEGGPRGVAVRAHVARLLAAAADPNNLCRLFPGWQPYL